MDVRELDVALRGNIGNNIIYSGVYTSDKIPYFYERWRKPVMFIVNTLKSTTDIQIIGHWVAFYIESSRLIFFDSYGIHPYVYGEEIEKYVNNYKRREVNCVFFNHQIQPGTSVKCGLYVLFFIHYTSHYNIDSFTRITFSRSSLSDNDKFVTSYYFKYLNKSKSCKDWRYGKNRAITYEECTCLGKKFFFLFIFFIYLYTVCYSL